MSDDAIMRCQDAVAEGEMAARRAEALRRDMALERTALTKLRAELAREERRRRSLERPSPSRVVARLTRRLDRRLAASAAMGDELRAEIAVRQQAFDRLDSDLTAAWSRARLRSQDQTALKEALADHETQLIATGGALGDELGALQVRLGNVTRDSKEVSEALSALTAANDALLQVRELLARAGSWSAVDLWLGGGLISGLVKHDRLDDAANQMVQAQHALLRLRSELADVAMGDGAGLSLGVSPSLKAFDIWFDNIISDWMVANRIRMTDEAVRNTMHRLANIHRQLGDRDAALTRELGELRGRRSVVIEMLTARR